MLSVQHAPYISRATPQGIHPPFCLLSCAFCSAFSVLPTLEPLKCPPAHPSCHVMVQALYSVLRADLAGNVTASNQLPHTASAEAPASRNRTKIAAVGGSATRPGARCMVTGDTLQQSQVVVMSFLTIPSQRSASNSLVQPWQHLDTPPRVPGGVGGLPGAAANRAHSRGIVPTCYLRCIEHITMSNSNTPYLWPPWKRGGQGGSQSCT